MQLSLETVDRLGACLLSLLRLSRQAAPEQLVGEALEALRPLVPFDSAWWGQVLPGTGVQPPRNWLHGSVGLCASFSHEWNRLASLDPFAHQSMARVGEVAAWSALDRRPCDEALGAFCRRHGLFHGVAITLELPGSGLPFFVALYRGPAHPRFDAGEASLFDAFSRHLLQHWDDRLAGLDPPVRRRAAAAVVEAQGRLLYLGRHIGQRVQQAYPGWSGTRLPDELWRPLADGRRVVPLGRAVRLHAEPRGHLLALALHTGEAPRAPLPPRAAGVAALYAEGRSYKEIAACLGLTPATVRTYLRQAYQHLGVRNKIELAQALRAP